MVVDLPPGNIKTQLVRLPTALVESLTVWKRKVTAAYRVWSTRPLVELVARSASAKSASYACEGKKHLNGKEKLRASTSWLPQDQLSRRRILELR